MLQLGKRLLTGDGCEKEAEVQGRIVQRRGLTTRVASKSFKVVPNRINMMCMLPDLYAAVSEDVGNDARLLFPCLDAYNLHRIVCSSSTAGGHLTAWASRVAEGGRAVEDAETAYVGCVGHSGQRGSSRRPSLGSLGGQR